MNILKIHKTLVSGRFTVIVSILLVLFMRLPAEPDWDNYVFWAVLGIHIGIALILLQLNHSFTIIRNKTMLSAVFYLLLTGTNPELYYDITGSIAALSILLCLLLLFSSYQDPESQRNTLCISLILMLCSFVWTPVLFFFPLIWYGFYRFRCFNYRTFFATIIGVLTVYLFIFTWNVYNNDIHAFLNFLPDKKDFLVCHSLNFSFTDWIISGYILLLYIVSIFRLYFSGSFEKVRTSTFLRYLYVLSIAISVLLLLQSKWKTTWVLILYVPISLMLSHYFSLSVKKLQTWILLFSFIVFFVIYILILWG